MIRTRIPKRGDVCLGNKETREVFFVKRESVTALTDINLDVYEINGIVLARRGDEVLIDSGVQQSKKWSDRYSFKLTGYTLDGTDRTGKLNVWTQGSVARDTSYTIAYNASTVDELVSQLNTAFQDETNYPALKAQDWCAVKESDDSISLNFTYTVSYQASNTGSEGFALTANLMPDIIAVANVRRNHGGVGGEGAISNWYRAIAYFKNDNSSVTYNPNTDVTSIRRTYPLCLPAYLGTSQYQSDHCALLRQTYGEGQQGWLKFMQSCLPIRPTDWGTMGIMDGLERTKILAEKRFTSLTQTDAVLCPAANFAYEYGTVTIPQGNWYLPTMRDLADMLDGIKYNSDGGVNADEVNAILNILHLTQLANNSYLWSCVRSSASYAWYANGGNGFFGSVSMYVAYGCRPVSTYKLA